MLIAASLFSSDALGHPLPQVRAFYPIAMRAAGHDPLVRGGDSSSDAATALAGERAYFGEA
jgi:hypothetical protein